MNLPGNPSFSHNFSKSSEV